MSVYDIREPTGREALSALPAVLLFHAFFIPQANALTLVLLLAVGAIGGLTATLVSAEVRLGRSAGLSGLSAPTVAAHSGCNASRRTGRHARLQHDELAGLNDDLRPMLPSSGRPLLELWQPHSGDFGGSP